jgi:predicted kinase
MIVWLNGTFGAGKTTTARELVKRLPDARLFDSEYVGLMLRHVLSEVPVGDFQEWRPWRGLVVQTAIQVLDYLGGTLVIPQTVLVEQYWREIEQGLSAAGIPITHLLLHAEREELIRRIEKDSQEAGASTWRLDHLDPYEQARPWLDRAAQTIDTTSLTLAEVVETIVTTYVSIPLGAPDS